ncbi:hypothetical protein DICPUDRAFT_148983 [Dictyostelium purpureum]|uniref:Telomere length regulation protein conserved domain-containing protein n=1 Tax=Dictyostelium purpureum TaxID=5786 RepID=F0ZCI3_DICPU|nr:uncharacterized protein DICPUDRAFT_148983 [Dictyostelium purpureum]EGC38373.1 hypothetical protein DICPUDRAFT_148983 [Dictyostelium purpureum]|eukprot:XP_003285130.1 hypothetical protein DICPUDRAFT_148983 [Dictyostelium purpureum]
MPIDIKEIINNVNSTKDIKIVIDQLRDLKQSIFQLNSDISNNDNHLTITSILKLLIENVLDNWYFAFTEPDKQLFESFFFIPNILLESFITITTILNEYQTNKNNNNDNNQQLYSQKLSFLFNILYKFLNNNNNNSNNNDNKYLSKLFIEFINRKINKQNQESNNNEIYESIWNLIVNSICSVPDKSRSIQYYYKNNSRIRGGIKQSPLSNIKESILEFFTTNSIYFNNIIEHLIISINNVLENNCSNNKIILISNQISILFTKMIKTGDKDIIINKFFVELFKNTTDNNIILLKRKIQCQIVIGIHGSCLDSFLESLIKALPNYLLYSLLKVEKIEKKDEKAKGQMNYDEGEEEYEKRKENQSILFTILNNLLKSWKDSYFIRHCTNEHHSYITRSIIYFIEKVNDQDILKIEENSLNKLKSLLLNGVDLHLKITISNINVRGMFVAEIFSKLFYNQTSEGQLHFDYSLDTPDQKCFSTNFKPVFKDIINSNNNKGNISNKENSNNNKMEHYRELLEKEFSKYDDPDMAMEPNEEDEEDEKEEKVYNKRTNNTQEKRKAFIEEIDDEAEIEDSDDDLVPYNLEDDESDLNPNLKKKIYLRDCLLELQSSKHTAESWENSLFSISKIVWSNPDDLDELAQPLASSLLHLSNEYDLDGFSQHRHEALVALATQSPAIVVPFLTNSFKESNFSVGQRLEILDTIAESAKELSGSNSKEQQQSQPQQEEFITQQPKLINEIGIVRRWGIKKTPRPIIKTNKFYNLVSIYFYPLLERYDKVTQCYSMDLLGYDHYLLSRLIYTLGVIVECSGNSIDSRKVSKELVSFCWSLRNHQDTNVRRSLLFALSRVFYSKENLTKQIIDQDYSDEIEDITSFLYEISQSDSDKDSRMMSMATLSKILTVLKINV